MTTNQPQYWTDCRIHVDGCGPEGPFVVALNTPYAVIGNYEKAHVRLQAAGVARRHLFALATDEGIYLMNFVDGRRQKRQDGVWLKPDEVIQVADYELRFGLADQSVPIKTPNVGLLERTVPRPFPMMRCKSGGAEIGRPYLNRPLALVGRRVSCKYQFTTRSISPEHCALYQQDGKLWVIDFQTTGKTKLDKTVIECGLLEHGTHLQIGRVHIKVYMGKTHTAPPKEDLPTSDSPEPRPSLIAHDSQESTHPLLSEPEPIEQSEPGPTLTNETEKHSNDLQLATQGTQQGGDSEAMETLRTEQARSQAKIQQLHSRLAESQSELQVTQSKLTSTEKLLQQTLADSQRVEFNSLQLDTDLAQQAEEHKKTINQLTQASHEILEIKAERDAERNRSNDLATQHSETQSRLFELQNEIKSAQTESDDLRTALAEAQHQKKAHTKWEARLDEREAELIAEAERLKHETDQTRLQEQALEALQARLDQRQRELETQTQQQEQLRQREAAESKTRDQLYESRNKELSQHQAEIDQAAQTIDAVRAQLDCDQTAVKAQQAQLQEAEKEWAGRCRNQDQIETSQTELQQRLDHQKATLEQKTISLTEQSELVRRENQETREQLQRLRDELDQRQTDLTLHAENLIEQNKRQRAEEENKTAIIRAELKAESKRVEANQQKRQETLAAREEELAAREQKISSDEENIQTDRNKIAADRNELDRYFAIDSTQRQVLANLSSIRKEKSLANRIWSKLGFPFRKG